MNSFKKILLVLCFLLSFSLFACSPVSLSTRYYESGGIESKLTLKVDELMNIGSGNYTSKISIIYEIIAKYNADLNNAYEDRMIELFSNKYDMSSMDSKSEKMSYIISFNPLFDKEIIISPTPSKFNFVSTENIVITGKFASVYSYVMFFCPDAMMYDEEDNVIKLDKEKISLLTDIPSGNSKVEISQKFFTTTFIQTVTPFSYNLDECKSLSDWRINGINYPANTSLLDICCTSLGISESEGRFMFSFLTPYKRVDSNGTLSKSGNLYTHVWTFDNMTTSVKFYRTVANYLHWYLAIFILGIVLMIIGLVTAYFINKHKKEKGMKYMQHIATFVEEEQQNKAKDNDQEIDEEK